MTRIATSSYMLTVALAVAACTRTDAPERTGAANESAESPAPSSPAGETEDTAASPPPDGDARPDEPATDPFADFDADRARADASALLGLSEADIEPSRELRIARRGDERFPMTMDLRPGRMNVELDERDGVYVVTRVSVETPDEPMVVE